HSPTVTDFEHHQTLISARQIGPETALRSPNSPTRLREDPLSAFPFPIAPSPPFRFHPSPFSISAFQKALPLPDFRLQTLDLRLSSTFPFLLSAFPLGVFP